MSDQPLDLRLFMRIMWRRKMVVGLAALAGILVGVAVGLLSPPMLSSTATVMLPPSVPGLPGGPPRSIKTEVVIAGSNPVLAGAGRRLVPAVGVQVLRQRVQVSSPSPQLIAISGMGRTAGQAEAVANAVARSYVAYLASVSSPGVRVPARVLEGASSASGTPAVVRLVVTGVLGLLAGVLLGAVVALAVSRGDRRLRERDEIADAIGVPVVASVPAGRPGDAAGWARLLEEYEPGPVEAWSLRQALHHLGLTEAREGGGASLAVVSLASDRAALALGPQLAAFASSLGMTTAFVVGPQQDEDAAAMLRTACAGLAEGRPLRSGWLRVSTRDRAGGGPAGEAPLTVTPVVVDAAAPRVADAVSAAVTVLGVSAGAVTAEQLARVAVSAARDGRQIAGIVVANPDPADHTTGRLPQLRPRGQVGRPTRAAGREW